MLSHGRASQELVERTPTSFSHILGEGRFFSAGIRCERRTSGRFQGAETEYGGQDEQQVDPTA